MRYTSAAALFTALLIVSQSCKKTSSPTSSLPAGGKGGTASVSVIPEHHGQLVDSCIIYIKYGTNDAPANGVYDDSVNCVLKDTTPVAVFSGMKAGAYYLYAQGFHPGYVPPYVKGGLPCNIEKETDSDVVYLPTYSYNK